MTDHSPIRLDASPVSGIVVTCDECPFWFAFRFGKTAAWDAACDHEERAHPDDDRQRQARHKRNSRARHAAHS